MMKNTASIHHISLEHLKDEEVEMILKVLERDAQIQKSEEARREKLRDSIRFERIPGKRLSVKIRTGDWISEISEPSRQKEKRGTDIVRASIRRKKWNKEDSGLEKVDEYPGNERLHSTKPDVVREADKLDVDPVRSPVRKTSIRRKQVSAKAQGKQVTFNDDKTEKIEFKESTEATVPTIEVQSADETVESQGANERYDKKVEVTVITDEDSNQKDNKQYDHRVYSADTAFESYHHSYGPGISPSEDKSDVQEQDKQEKVAKKVRVVKRKGSSRRKVVNRLTDDSDRDNLFRAPEFKEIKDEGADDRPSGSIELEIVAVTNHPVVEETPSVNTNYDVTSDIVSEVAVEPAVVAVSDYSVVEETRSENINFNVTSDTAKEPAIEPAGVAVSDYPDIKHSPSHHYSYDLASEATTDDTKESEVIQTLNVEQGYEAVKYETMESGADELPKPEDHGYHATDSPVAVTEPHDGSNDLQSFIPAATLGIAQDYDDVTLKPGDISKVTDYSEDVNVRSGISAEGDEDGGRTPTTEKSEQLDGMELLKEIEAALPQVSKGAAVAENDATDATYEPAATEDAKTDETSKPKKKIIRKVRKSKHAKQDDANVSPRHEVSQEGDDDARTLIDEVAKSMMSPEQGDTNRAPSPEPGRKKIVKKVVKKKKAEDSNAADSTKADDENTADKAEGDEEFGMARRKTVRRKVIRKPPPKPQE